MGQVGFIFPYFRSLYKYRKYKPKKYRCCAKDSNPEPQDCRSRRIP